MKRLLFLIFISLYPMYISASISFGIGYGGGWPYYGGYYDTGFGGPYWAGDWDNYYPGPGFYGPGFGFGVNIPLTPDYQDDGYARPRRQARWQDNVGKDYWYIINKTGTSITVRNDEDSITIRPNNAERLSHRKSFKFTIKLPDGRSFTIKTTQHRLTVYLNQQGKIIVT